MLDKCLMNKCFMIYRENAIDKIYNKGSIFKVN